MMDETPASPGRGPSSTRAVFLGHFVVRVFAELGGENRDPLVVRGAGLSHWRRVRGAFRIVRRLGRRTLTKVNGED